ncbi:MAG: HEAT repeat domain-containing protein [Anaerolineales bacterium]|nr:HEAT repeat domain-containing protein [Anaerolineales bacterium]
MRGWRFDLWSFLLGILTSGLIFLLAKHFLAILAGVWQSLRQVLQILLPLRSNLEVQFRKDLIRFCQKEHLLSQLFPLEELLIPAKVLPLTPPLERQESLIEDITTEAVPLVFDDPILASSYQMHSFPLVEILAKGNSLLIILGELGAGKTTALLEVATTIARCNHPHENLYHCLPLYITASRLLKEKDKKIDPIQVLVEATRENYSASVRSSLLHLARKATREKRLILMIDGLDETPPHKVDELSDFIKILQKQYPDLKIILAASPNYLSDFVSMGFSPLLLCSWNKNDARNFLQKWGMAWLAANIASREEVALWTAWASQESDLLTPLEWTLFLLLLFLKRPTAPQPHHLLASSLDIAKLEPSSQREISHWAYQALKNALDNKPHSPPPSVMDKLHPDEIFVKVTSQEIRLANPIFLSLFASFVINEPEEIDNFGHHRWDVAVLAARLATSHNDSTHSIEFSQQLTKDELLKQGRYLPYIQPKSKDLKNWIKLAAKLILSDQEPKYFRAKLFSTLLRSRVDESPQFVKFLLQSKDPFLRQLGALGYGLLKNVSDIQPLVNLIEDPLPNCFQAACLALVNIGTPTALDAVISALIHGHDRLKEAAAQALANDPQIGHAILKEAAQHEDARVRKATISALFRIGAPWSKAILQKITIEENVWVIKDAAANAVAVFDLPNPFIPQKKPEPANLPWLIQFAAQKGIGLAPGKTNQDVLLRALEEGDPEIQRAVLDFLRFTPFDIAVPLIENLLPSPDKELQSAAYQTLWSFSVCRRTANQNEVEQ